MKGFNFFDRQSRKTLEGLVASHLHNEYHLPPRAAQTLCEDALVFGRLWGNQTRAPGQILFHAVAVDEPAGKPLRDCRMIEIRLTLRADADLELRRDQGLGALHRALVVRLCREANELWQMDVTYIYLPGYGWHYAITVIDYYSRYLLACYLTTSYSAVEAIHALGLAREEAERLCGPLPKSPFLVTDNGPSFIARRFGKYTEGRYSHVRIQYRTPTQLGLLEEFRSRYNRRRPHWAFTRPSLAIPCRFAPQHGPTPFHQADSLYQKQRKSHRRRLTQNRRERFHLICVPRHYSTKQSGCAQHTRQHVPLLRQPDLDNTRRYAACETRVRLNPR